ncbi:MAG: hypothetical protein Nkreftii_002696 [Candidatus Nitrospira kreftii]|uniref:Uncharacterized protein n=1 Tax=Candidatus Nitrospira kreftii TaxID=2652173 RepID=A0A7S8IZA2_9BACT|nr:MAG: hypothetical protein Nkreftii_002696 [Candidatus Nitrospira kreftii]
MNHYTRLRTKRQWEKQKPVIEVDRQLLKG